MSEWVETLLASVICPLESGKRPSGGVSSETEGVPSLGGENIDAAGKMSYSNVNRISPTYARTMSKGKLKAGDTLINKDGAQTGKVAQYDGAFPEAWINEHVFIVRSDPSKIQPDYLFYTMLDGYAQQQIAARITGSAQPGLNSDFATVVKVRLPQGRNAQAKIGRVLRALDTQIEATEALITKQERVRAGLMQDLFTRGVDEHGQIRLPRDQAPHLYHQTELGWLPTTWQLARLKDFPPQSGGHLKTGPFGSALKIEHWVAQGRPVITIGSLGEGALEKSELLFVSEETANHLISYQLFSGDVVFSRVADVGRSVVITCENTGWIMSSNLMRIRLDFNHVRPNYLHLQLSFDSVLRGQLRRSINSGGRDVANAAILNALKFVWPMPDEQDRICGVSQALEAEMEKHRARLAKLRLQKSGLMQDLLTGKVAVTPLLETRIPEGAAA